MVEESSPENELRRIIMQALRECVVYLYYTLFQRGLIIPILPHVLSYRNHGCISANFL